MSSLTKITCAECGGTSYKSKGEINRRLRLGKTRFFCGPKCAGAAVNRAKRNSVIDKECAYCGSPFQTTSGAKPSSHCSRGCASANSVTEYRRTQARRTIDLHSTELSGASPKNMRAREGWRYVAVRAALIEMDEPNRIESQIDHSGPIFDMLLPARRIVIEFDGPYHDADTQRRMDAKRDAYAHKKGWIVHRVTHGLKVKVFDPAPVLQLLNTLPPRVKEDTE